MNDLNEAILALILAAMTGIGADADILVNKPGEPPYLAPRAGYYETDRRPLRRASNEYVQYEPCRIQRANGQGCFVTGAQVPAM